MGRKDPEGCPAGWDTHVVSQRCLTASGMPHSPSATCASTQVLSCRPGGRTASRFNGPRALTEAIRAVRGSTVTDFLVVGQSFRNVIWTFSRPPQLLTVNRLSVI